MPDTFQDYVKAAIYEINSVDESDVEKVEPAKKAHARKTNNEQ